jgi:hypothetical protein
VRFSLKWILAGMVYVAIAAAAIARGEWYYADVVLGLTIVGLTFAVVTAIYSRGKRQACAVGFTVGCASFLGYLQFGGQTSPAWRLIEAAGLDKVASGKVEMNVPPLDSDDPFGPATPVTVQVDTWAGSEVLSSRSRAANAVARWPSASWVRWWA